MRWSLDPGRTHVRRRRVGTSTATGAPGLKLFFSIRRSMERLSLRTSVLARCWLTMWNVQKRFMPASTF